ncbi:interference hedgehog [Anopheles darlingi]|uniref:interference hedgehog n=1 Tax=Anopheles darlingi TaxID=43151 RepID=UPI0021001B10|nr:interference hedgehog [Anopheles darlingi]XP_049531622.1 interference hedgehog [Anopheles darlingi]
MCSVNDRLTTNTTERWSVRSTTAQMTNDMMASAGQEKKEATSIHRHRSHNRSSSSCRRRHHHQQRHTSSTGVRRIGKGPSGDGGGQPLTWLVCLCLALFHSVTCLPAQSYPQSSSATAHHTHHHSQHHPHQAPPYLASGSSGGGGVDDHQQQHPHNHHHSAGASAAAGQSSSSYGGSSRSSGSSAGSSSGSSIGLHMIRSPESTIAPADDEVLFECELNLLPERLDWRFRPQGASGARKDYVYIGKNQTGYNVSVVDDRFKLRVLVSERTIGEYQCVAWFGASALASIPARLTLATIGLEQDNTASSSSSSGLSTGSGSGRYDRVPSTMMRRVLPTIPQQHYKVYPGNSIIVDCGEIISNPPPIWSYYKDGMTIYPNVTQIQTGRRLILPNLTQRDSGTYWCSAVNSITGSEVVLPQKTTIQVDYVARSAPRALSLPLNVSVIPGDTALLECPGVGNPVPVASWTRVNGIPLNSRARVQDYGLQITNVHPEDDGVYVCRLQNGIEPALVHSIRLTVLEQPRIIAPPRSTLTNESDSLELECVARGSPRPEIYWMINGDYAKWDALIRTNGSRMIIQSVEKRHAGIVQCFARNEVGEASEGNLLQVNPKQIPGGIGSVPLGSVPSGARVGGDHAAKRKGGKKHKHLVMIPPSRPNITRLSDESVMIRWSVPSTDGLPIQFFKVQYRMLGDPTKNIARTQWMTENEDIPPYTRSYEVNNLKSDHLYRFRIVAVYSNNDNKEGAASGKFHLQRGSQLGLTKNHLLAPTLTRIEPVSQQAVVLHWQFPLHLPHPIDGFYAYYRAATTAGEYSKATVDSSTARHFKIDHLEPGTAYEFKLQSFTASAASDFSAILTGRTLKPPTPPPTVPSVIAASEGADRAEEFPKYMLVTGGIVFLFLLFSLVICCCMGRRKKRGHGSDDIDAKVHIPVDQNGFASGGVGGVSNGGGRVLHKSTRVNGMNGRMNITPNPLAQDGDKNRTVIELRFLPNTLIEGGVPEQRETGSLPMATTATTAAAASSTTASGGWRRKKPTTAATSKAASTHKTPTSKDGVTTDGSNNEEATGDNDNHDNDIDDNHDDSNDGGNGTVQATNNNNLQSIPNQQQQQQQQHHHHIPASHNLPPLPLHPGGAATTATAAMNSCGVPQQQQQQQQQQQYPEHLMLISLPHRRTLERGVRTAVSNGGGSNSSSGGGGEQKMHHDGSDTTGGVVMGPARNSSIRRTRRGSGSVPGSPRIGRGPSSEFLQQQQQQPGGVTVARSPMPIRAAGGGVKRGARLGRAENMSSGSLNSIEV